MEQQLIGASLKSRDAFSKIKSYINVTKYSKQFQLIFSKVSEYYQADAGADNVDPDVLDSLLAEKISNIKHLDDYKCIIREALARAGEVSEDNVARAVLLSKKQEVGDNLAHLILERKDHEKIMEEYNNIYTISSLDEYNEKGLEVYTGDNLRELLLNAVDNTNLIKVYPSSLNDRIDGGLSPGNHILIYGRPESGKTLFAVNMAAGFSRHGHKGIYFINEDTPGSIALRLVSNLSGMTKHEIQANFDVAMLRANDAGFRHINIVSCAPGTPRQMESYIEKYSPDWIVVDQIRNIDVKADGPVQKLEKAATEMRNIAKRNKIVVVSVTQAGDSATDKEVLEMSDIDSSKTGLPAQMDLMVGVGVTSSLEEEGYRMLSLPKNKLSGQHVSFPVKVRTDLSRVVRV